MRTMTFIIFCAVCITAGCSREENEQSAQAPVVTKKMVRDTIVFPEISRQWVRTIGKNLPAHIDNLPMEKATAAKKVITGMADNLLDICTNRTEKEVHEIVHRLEDMTDGLGYNMCGQYLWKLKYAFENFSFHGTFEMLELPPKNFSQSISNYCYLAGAVSDICWTKAGRCFQAQVIDHSQFRKLKYLSNLCKKKKWDTVQPIVDRLKQEWIEKRFDAPDCHLRIVCDEIGEDAGLDKTGLDRPWSIRDRYDNMYIFFAVKAVGRYPKWLKGEVKDVDGKVLIPSKK